jgi:hypothetical protein
MTGARLLIALSLLAFAAGMLLDVSPADARHNKYYRYHYRGGGWIVPPPPGKSRWCRENPHLCYERTDKDTEVETRCEACMDRYCNGDGYIADWEMRRARKLCMVCN